MVASAKVSGTWPLLALRAGQASFETHSSVWSAVASAGSCRVASDGANRPAILECTEPGHSR